MALISSTSLQLGSPLKPTTISPPQEARKFCWHRRGAWSCLTHPWAAGYVQNPISVYYCYAADGSLPWCIAEVHQHALGSSGFVPI
eukprot:jgi/Botrbrau1/7799/Bobra.0159s0227.1